MCEASCCDLKSGKPVMWLHKPVTKNIKPASVHALVSETHFKRKKKKRKLVFSLMATSGGPSFVTAAADVNRGGGGEYICQGKLGS